MLISCNSCNSKYLVNSAELKPDGRNVQCANCGNQWFQESQVFDDNVKEDLNSEVNDGDSLNQEKNKTSISNLPSTYVQEPKVSILNSILLVLFVILLIIFYWFFQKSNINSLVLIKFYINEFFFNLNMIINDIAKIIHQLIN
tara:strand:+ start:68 stop:496 length:429 start_codon:yes stop_codon:yes gene_type:complete